VPDAPLAEVESGAAVESTAAKQQQD